MQPNEQFHALLKYVMTDRNQRHTIDACCECLQGKEYVKIQERIIHMAPCTPIHHISSTQCLRKEKKIKTDPIEHGFIPTIFTKIWNHLLYTYADELMGRKQPFWCILLIKCGTFQSISLCIIKLMFIVQLPSHVFINNSKNVFIAFGRLNFWSHTFKTPVITDSVV